MNYWMRVYGLMLATLISVAMVGAQTPPKIYISADMEGVTGVVTSDQLGPGGFEYNRFRKFMTDEVNAAIAGARAAGAGTIVVSDSHGNGENLLIEELPSDIELVRAWPRPLMMMEGIDETFDGIIFVGYHTGTQNLRGVRAHTISSARLTGVRLNGIEVPEAGINAAIGGHFGVPVIMITGDDAIVEEARNLLGEIEAAVVKRAIGFHSAQTLMPEAAQRLIREAAQRAVQNLGKFKPYQLDAPIQLEVDFKNYRAAEVLEYLPIVQRIGAHSIRFAGKDMVETSRFLQFLGHYEPGIEP